MKPTTVQRQRKRFRSQIAPSGKDDVKGSRRAFFMEGVPSDTISNFKAACALKKESMKDALIKLMRQYTGQKYKMVDPED